MKIVFMGTPDFSVPTLEQLHADGHEVQAVFTQPDKARGRGRKMMPTPVKQKAMELGLPVYQPLSLRKGEDAEAARNVLQELQPDLIVVIAYGQILPKEILTLPKHGCINLHASLLPRWRGAAPIQRAVLSGDTESGVTAMQMAEGLDTGDMLYTLKTQMTEEETADSLHDRLSAMSARVIHETLELLQQGGLRPVKQDDAQACYAEKITKEMSALDFSAAAETVDRTIRGITGYAVLKGKRVKIYRSCMAEGVTSDAPAGTVKILSKKTFGVVCGDGKVVQLLYLQAEGGKPLDAQTFMNGSRLSEADCFVSAETAEEAK
ncbi:MAG: methionyl-tRNA formyltransferase [Oscillospiraceae bacterium]|nr:methionyl-tRNA formyltransferase [Oscillospiraceae bacterium]